jgi:hypothetical protein
MEDQREDKQDDKRVLNRPRKRGPVDISNPVGPNDIAPRGGAIQGKFNLSVRPWFFAGLAGRRGALE